MFTDSLPSSLRSRRSRRAMAMTMALCALLPTATAWGSEVRVFTDRLHPVTAIPGIRITELDAPTRLEAELAAQLPADRAQAAAIVQQRLQQGGFELQRRMASAYQGVADAWSLGVTKIPAVVVDGRYVVYGEPDVARALARIEAYRSPQP